MIKAHWYVYNYNLVAMAHHSEIFIRAIHKNENKVIFSPTYIWMIILWVFESCLIWFFNDPNSWFNGDNNEMQIRIVHSMFFIYTSLIPILMWVSNNILLEKNYWAPHIELMS